MTITDTQLAKLPQYARWEIERLAKDAAYYEAKFEDAKKGLLARGSLIVGLGMRLDFEILEPGRVELTCDGDHRLVIAPRSANAVVAELRDYP